MQRRARKSVSVPATAIFLDRRGGQASGRRPGTLTGKSGPALDAPFVA